MPVPSGDSSRTMPAEQPALPASHPTSRPWLKPGWLTVTGAIVACIGVSAWISPWLLAALLGLLLGATLLYVGRVGKGIARSLNVVTKRRWDEARQEEVTTTLLPDLTEALHGLQDWAEERDIALRDAIQRERLNSLELEVQTLELNDAHERLAEANAELKAFTYSASHDLAVPLRTIESFASLLREQAIDQLDESSAGFVTRIETTASRARSLVADLLVLSRMRDSDETEYVEIDLDVMVDSIAEELRESLPGPFVVEHGPLCRFIAPQERIRPILQNLIQNGLKYNVSEVPTVRVDAAVDGGIVFINIRDNGIGIPEGDRDEIFGLFRRGQAAAKFAGTGAGLAIARRAARSLNGELWLEASSSRGSHFAMAVPIGEAEEKDRPWLTNYIERRDEDSDGEVDSLLPTV